MSLSELQCCMTPWGNGSVSYTLSHAPPPGSIITWTLKDMVIVNEDGDTDENYVEGPTGNGYILREQFSEVVYKLESLEKGVSKDVPCTGLCNSAHLINPDGSGSSISQLQLGLIVGFSVFFLLCLIVGIWLHSRCQRKSHHDNGSDVEMHPVPSQDRDEDQNQDFLEDQEDLNTEEHLTSR